MKSKRSQYPSVQRTGFYPGRVEPPCTVVINLAPDFYIDIRADVRNPLSRFVEVVRNGQVKLSSWMTIDQSMDFALASYRACAVVVTSFQMWRQHPLPVDGSSARYVSICEAQI